MGANFVTAGPVPDAGNDGVSSAAVNLSAGLATVVAPLSGKRIFVHGLLIASQASIAFTAMDMTSSSGTVAFPLGTIGLQGGTPLKWGFGQYPLFTIAPGDALAFSVSGAVGGRLLYVQG